MASIPCAAYQASHISAHMRRQNMRTRHNSTNSTDSDGNQSPEVILGPSAHSPGLLKPRSPLVTGVPTVNPMVPQEGVNMAAAHNVSRMDRVAGWVGDHMTFKIWRPHPGLQTSDLNTPPTMENKSNSEATTFSQNHVLKSES